MGKHLKLEHGKKGDSVGHRKSKGRESSREKGRSSRRGLEELMKKRRRKGEINVPEDHIKGRWLMKGVRIADGMRTRSWEKESGDEKRKSYHKGGGEMFLRKKEQV